MATIVLQAAGAFLGGAFGAVGSAIGSAAGAMAGYIIDRALIDSTKRYEGPRLRTAAAFTAEDGAPLPRLYGTVRTSGTLIWATRFEEVSTTERQGGKGGGPKVTTYSYFANAAFALCEGEIAGVRRIWADGREIDRNEVEIRVYRGSEDQPIDPLIEAKQGAGNAPAYRGTAYVVIERFPIDEYGRRVPQFQFEVMRPSGELNGRIRSIALIPGSTEYGLATTLVRRRKSPGETEAENRHVRFAATDLEASLDELQMLCPNLKSVSLVVSWFGTDLRAGQCKIRPMVADGDGKGLSIPWVVSGISREDAVIVSRDESGRAAYGGTPADVSVKQAIRAIRQRGLKVALYPFIMMDVPPGNELPDPYGGDEQAAYPWRGRITCFPAPGGSGTPDKTSAIRPQIEALAGTASPADFVTSGDTIRFTGLGGEWSYRRFLLHYAHLAAAAGGVDAFIIGSELRGLTTLRDHQNLFPFVEVLEDLAGEVRSILDGTTITYAADWSEYFGYQPADGSGDVFFHLDSLWAHPAIDAVGIDNYMPLSDWRDEDASGGSPDGFSGSYDLEALRAGIASGEGFDWYYASAADRVERVRTPITDGAYGKPWVYRYKDLVGWWSNQHFNRVGGVEEASPTAWLPRSKPIHFTELGCPAIDKGPNQPNLFPDPKSSESAIPYFSTGGRSDLAQYRLLLAHYRHWEEGGKQANPISPIYDGPMVDVDAITLWAWDARPFPAYPLNAKVWGDSANWAGGHWLNGRLSGISASALIAGILADHGLPAADTDMADGMMTGYVVSHPTTARAALAPLTTLFGISVREDGERLVFLTEGAMEGPALKLEELVLEEGGSVAERTRDPDHALPAMAHLDFTDLMKEHQSATAAIDYIGAKGTGTAYLSFPGVLSAGEANRLLRAFLRRQWDGRERVTFSLPASEQKLELGAIIRLPGSTSDYLINEMQDGVTRRISARRIVRAADAPAPEPEVAGISNRGEGYLASKPHVLFLDLPTRPGEEAPQDQFRLAARAVPWRRQAALVSPEGSGFALRATLDRRAVLGILEETLPPGRVLGRIDRSATLTVHLYDGELESVSRVQLLNGANAAAVKSLAGTWEIIQFEAAEEIAPSLWRLSGLLRGQLGTEDAMQAGVAAGADFVLLDEAVRSAGLKAEEIGLELNWRVGPAGADISDENFLLAQSVIGGVRALLPLSPVHLRTRKVGGDIHFSWIRRGRINADSWLVDEIPLGEERELYRIEIAPVGGAAVRSATSEAPSWTYTVAMQADDFSQPPEAIEVFVRQISTAAGAGIAVRRTIHLS